jgi:hypothetical protein
MNDSVGLETRRGDVEIGIPEDTPAWLEVRARTTAGDALVRRPRPGAGAGVGATPASLRGNEVHPRGRFGALPAATTFVA